MEKVRNNPSLWLYIFLAFMVGSGIGCIVTRWHYKNLYSHSTSCGPISYYDKQGKTVLFTDSTCR